MSLFEYALLRVVPRVERGEFINAGVVLYCQDAKFLEARIRLVNDRLGRAQVIEPADLEGDRVRFGAIVEIEDLDSGERETWQIVGEDEADAKEGRISVTSPIARALLGKEVDATVRIVVPRGTREVLVVCVRYG